ncbi:hypothetical protein D3C84_581120 [compost metagenome]
MFCGVEGNVDPGFLAEITRPHTGAVHHELSVDIALSRDYAGGLAILDLDVQDLGVFNDFSAAHSSTLGECLGDVNRVDHTVQRQIHATDDVFDVQQWPQVKRLLRVDHFTGKATKLGHRRAALEFGETFLVSRDAQGTVTHEASGLTGFCFKALVQTSAVLRQHAHVVGRAQGRHQAGSMPGRAAGQRLALQQHDILDAQFGQVVCNAAPDNPTTDDDDTSRTRNGIAHFKTPGPAPQAGQLARRLGVLRTRWFYCRTRARDLRDGFEAHGPIRFFRRLCLTAQDHRQTVRG